MTISTTTNRWSYAGNGVTTVFAYTNKIFAATDLKIYLDGVLQVSGYAVSGVGVVSGGSVTFTPAPANGVAVTIVAVDDPAGAGVGTTAPASTALTPSKLKIKVKHTTTGKDKIDLKATLTMPAGFVAGSHPVEVCVGPVKVAFTIAENGKATLPDGSKIKLKWSGRDGDDPIGAGVTAKLKIKLRGDFAERLTAANMRDADEIRSVEEFPFAFHLDGLCYEGSVTLAVTNRAGSKSKGKMTD